MRLYKTNKLVVLLSGNVEKLLNGVSTNTFDSVKNAFTDVFGKIIVTFDQRVINSGVLIVIEKSFLTVLLSHLQKFLSLSKVKCAPQDYFVYFNLDQDYQPQTTDQIKADHKPSRIVPQLKGQLILSCEELPIAVSDDEFTIFRLKNNIPLQGIDYLNEMLMNVDESFISFAKGCFLGQEVFARIKSRSKPPKKLVVKYEDDCIAEEKQHMTSKALDPETNKILGFVFVKNQC